MRSGVLPAAVKDANREEHKRMLAIQSLGMMVSYAAAEGVTGEDFEAFVIRRARMLCELSREHPVPIEERIEKAAQRYRFR